MNVARLWRTTRHLRFKQIYGRAWFKIVIPRPDCSPPPALRRTSGDWRLPACREPSLTGKDVFFFLNEEGSLAKNGWDDPSKPKLWRYNQHYFDDLNATGASAKVDWHLSIITNWIEKNLPGKGTGWEPYPTSLRIVNWVKWSLAGNSLPHTAVRSLATQARWLMRRLEWHLMGNHLFANAKALVYAGLYFAGPEAEKWLQRGLYILEQEIREQILPDGGQFELSPMYHALAIEDILDLINVATAFGRDDLASAWRLYVPLMVRWLRAMSHPDSRISFFNDAAFGIAPANSELEKYAERLGIEVCTSVEGLVHLESSGYLRMDAYDAVVIADLARIGPDYLPGHAHADTLSFEMSLYGRRLIVNSGTSVYGAIIERQRQRSTAAHSTVALDGQNSSEVWSSFRVGRRAYPRSVALRPTDCYLGASAAHNGYVHLSGKPIHRRDWRLNRGALNVTDRVTGSGKRRIEARFHLGANVGASHSSDGRVLLTDDCSNPIATLTAEGGTLSLSPTSWHPEFGKAVETQCVTVTAETDLPHEMNLKINW